MLECDALFHLQTLFSRHLGESISRRGFLLPMRVNGLSPKERAFVREYLLDENGKQAAIRAGYAPNSAEVQASRLLSKDKVWAAVEAGLKKLEERTLVTKAYVINGFKEVHQRCVQHQPVMEFDHEAKEMVEKKVLSTDPTTGEAKWVGVYEFDSSGANKALECLGKSIGIFIDKTEHSGTVRLEDLVGGSMKEDMEERSKRKAK